MAKGKNLGFFGIGRSRSRAKGTIQPDEALQQRIDFLSFTVEKQTRTRKEVLEGLEDGFFREDHEAVALELRSLSERFDVEEIEERIVLRMEQVGSVNEELTDSITECYKSFVEGMSKVEEMQQDLERAFGCAKEARNHLEDADAEVRHGISIARDTRKRQRLQQVLKMIKALKLLQVDMMHLEDLAPKEEFRDCFRLCMSLHERMMQMKELSCIPELQARLDDVLHDIIQRIDGLLMRVCESFEPERYLPILQAYLELDDPDVLAEKVQGSFTDVVLGKTSAIAREIVMSMPEQDFSSLKWQKIVSGSVAFSDLISHLTSEHFRPCLSRVMSTLFESYRSCHNMLLWHKEHMNRLKRSAEAQGARDPLIHREMEMCEKVVDTLELSRKALWNFGTKRVATILALPTGTEGEHFSQILEWMQVFLSIGEYFAGKDATVQLKAAFERQSARYFAAYHRQNLEMVSGMLEKEVWQALPAHSVTTPNLSAAFKTAECRQHAHSNVDGPWCWLEGPNPWLQEDREEDVEISSPHPVPMEAGGSNAEVEPSFGSPKDTENEGKLQDKEGSTICPATDDHPLGQEEDTGGKEQKCNVLLTPTSLKVLRLMEEYLGLIDVLSPEANVFGGVCQLFECCMLYTFQAFGLASQQTRHGAGIQAMNLNDLTPRLRRAILVISKSAESSGTFAKLPRSLSVQSDNDHGTFLRSTSERGGAMSQGNLYGLKERSVATESLVFMADELKKIRAAVLADQRIAQSPAFEQFFNRTLEASGDLREHVYRTAARLLLSVEWLPDRVGSTRYDIKEIGVQHNEWVNSLITEFRSLAARLSVAGISNEVLRMLLSFAVEVCARYIVEGLSRVRRCTQEGRGMMALDMQVLIDSLEKVLVGVPVSPPMILVDSYIKGFYVSEEGLVEWIQVHPEFTKAQVLSLLQCISNKYTIVTEEGRRKRKFLKDLSLRLG